MTADCPLSELLLFSSLFELGILLFLGAIVGFRRLQPRQPALIPTGQYDITLAPQLNQAGISDWPQFQQLTGLSTEVINHLRQGTIETLSVKTLTGAATCLDCHLDDLLAIYGLSTAHQEIRALRQEGLRLREELHGQQTALQQEWQHRTFEQLQPLLTNYPSLRQMVQVKPALPAKQIVSLLTSLDGLLRLWAYEPIGTAWEAVAFDPQLHQPDQPDIVLGELVYIRFVGYRCGSDILCPAKVSRTLPTAAQS